MTWFLLAIAGPFLYAITNFIDKVILERYFKVGGVGTILIFSGLMSVFVLPVLLFFDPTPFSMSLAHIAALAVVGIVNVLILFFYLKAISSDEVSVAIIFYQLVSVFAYVLGYLILGETLTTMQIAAMVVIIAGTSIVSFEIDEENHFHLKRRTILYMTLASFCWALSGVIFKAVALEEDVIRSFFWENFMMVVIGAGIFLFVRSYRNHFLEAFRSNGKSILLLNGLNEVVYISGNAVVAFAFMLAPVALVLLANSYQSIFVLAIGAFLTFFFPHLVKERVHLKNVGQKILAILVTAVGTYLLFLP